MFSPKASVCVLKVRPGGTYEEWSGIPRGSRGIGICEVP